jgi:FkbM family methyltransferase
MVTLVHGLLGRLTLVHRAWRYRIRLDPLEIRWLLGVLCPGDLAVDIGAHKGAYTYWMRRRVGPGGSVLAFEPQQDLARYLTGAVSIFGWRNVTVERIGLSNKPGYLALAVPGDGPSPSATFVPSDHPEPVRVMDVRVDTLDGYLGAARTDRPVRLIKCDVEGLELEVFEGARRTLTKDRPLLLFESEARHHPERGPQDVFRFLEALGYAGSFFWQGQRHPVRDFEAGVHQVVGALPYVNNFMFEPQDAPEARTGSGSG